MLDAIWTAYDMTRKRLVLLCALPLAAFVLIAAAPGAVRADQADERIDQEMGAFEDPKLLQILTSAPEPRVGHHGAQPFDQEPPAAQADFRPNVVTCFVNQQQQIVCQ